MDILILGASYGSLLSTKLLMAGHNVTLVCLPEEAELFNKEGSVVRIKLRNEDDHRSLKSSDLPGSLDAVPPGQVNLKRYSLVAFAMQEPQYAAPEVKALLKQLGESGLPCLSIMNMPPLAFLKRIDALKDIDLTPCYRDASVWDVFDPANVSLCSPDPQAFRPPEEKLNVLHVGLPTNFKAAPFHHSAHQSVLEQLASDIAELTLDGHNVPVKLKAHNSLFVPMAKWSMLLTGNYRCIGKDNIRPIREAVHSDKNASAEVYAFVDALVEKLGGTANDAVPFEKYASAAENLAKPSSAARAIDAGAPNIERVDRLVQTIAREFNMQHPVIDDIVRTVDQRLIENRKLREPEPA